MELAREEREEFAELLAGLSPQQWESPSLCERWRVRDVVAHVISYDELDFRSLAVRFAKGWFLQDRVNELGVDDLVDRTPGQLLELMRIHAEPSGLPAGFGGRIALVDGMIHQQDIRRPLAIPRTIPPRRLRVALDFARFAPLIRGAWRARGVKLVATDLDWSYGRGPQVSGSGEALLMAMAGRRDVLGDLTGPGRSKFAAHIGA
ncbi:MULTISPECIES: maleylpyruvate isomerase family mycothiol-dependent enzyme [Rhodococcus]|uniref:TIGR03083 family protein n=1 Tax=Rhodococcus koreensis TaxID=99653 RepID=A0A1H5AN94_9NOCA|nr:MULTISPECIES: maleylpyruvate isomerase family mycothiol-dependent enzyme [Rhodococcus]SED43702.1 TIGR03083 family protein [Rhodococcus koreensis]